VKKLGKYELLGELGRGAFGIVYRAKDPIINRPVALKTITSAVADNPSLLERFYREAQAAGSLQHSNIVTIYDMGEAGGTPFIAMELVDGPNLDDLVARQATLPLALKLGYGVQACRAFDYAHKRGIIHRDIKPGNVMVNQEGVVKVVDFGIARVLEASKTQTGALIGTFSYMAPELFHGEHATERSDIWSFGVLLYELLAYKQPFSGHSAAALMQSICMQEPVPLCEAAPDCPEDIAAVVHRMLRKGEAERFQTMEDVLLALEPICRCAQAEAIAEMLEQSRRLMQDGEFAQARDRLRDAMQLDPTHIEARALLEKANAELKRLSLRNKAQQHAEKGRSLLREGRLQEAAEEADSALQLDSQFAPARELRQEIQREIERLELVRQYLESARQRFAEGLPDEAENLLLKAKEADPANQQVLELQQQVLQEKERRRKRRQFLEGMQRARSLWTQRKYDECLALLAELRESFPGEDDLESLLETAREDQAEQNKQEKLAQARSLLVARRYEECIAALTKLQQEFPIEDEIARLLETARKDQAEQKKREKLAEARNLLSARRYQECIAVLIRLQQDLPGDDEVSRLLETARQDEAEHERKQKLAAARDLLAAQDFAEALALLDSLLARDPSDSAVLKLRTRAQREQEMQARSETLQREWEALKKLVSGKEYSQVVSRAEDLLRRFPGEADLTRLVEFARNQQAELEKEQRLRSSRDQVEEMLRSSRFADAEAAARAALEAFPGNADLASLLERAQTGKKERIRQMIEQRVREIKVKINRGELSEARDLARETITRLGPDTDVHQLLSSAEVEYEARERKQRQDEKLESVRSMLAARKLNEAAAALDALIKSGDFDPLDPRLYRVADEITAARAAGAATASIVSQPEAQPREYALIEGPPGAVVDPPPATRQTTPPLAAASPASTPAPEPPVPRTGSPAVTHAGLTPAAIDRASRTLARYVGPISAVLAKRAAKRADNLRAFYLLLAESLEAESDRASFLRDAGLPDL
jgi:serine/threonine-protein kinase